MNNNYINSQKSNINAQKLLKTSIALQIFPKLLNQKIKLTRTTYNQLLASTLDLKIETDAKLISEILMKPKRGKRDVIILQKALEQLSFFQDSKQVLPNSLYDQLFQLLFYKQVKAKTLLFALGDQADENFIILSGSVYVLQPIQNNNNNNSSQQKVQQAGQSSLIASPKSKNLSRQQSLINSPLHKQISQKSLSFDLQQALLITNTLNAPSSSRISSKKYKLESQVDQENALKEDILKGNHGFEIINELSQGDQFGEIAIQNICQRSATIVCKTDCEFICLKEADYHAIFSKFLQIIDQSITLGDYINEMRKHERISNYSISLLNQSSRNINTMILFIPNMMTLTDSIQLNPEKLKFNLKMLLIIKISCDCTNHKDFNQNFGSSSRIKLLQLGANSIFGEEGLLFDTRQTKAIVQEKETEVYEISIKQFLRVACKNRQEQSIEILRQMANYKFKWLSYQIQSIISVISKEKSKRNLFGTHQELYTNNKHLQSQYNLKQESKVLQLQKKMTMKECRFQTKEFRNRNFDHLEQKSNSKIRMLIKENQGLNKKKPNEQTNVEEIITEIQSQLTQFEISEVKKNKIAKSALMRIKSKFHNFFLQEDKAKLISNQQSLSNISPATTTKHQHLSSFTKIVCGMDQSPIIGDNSLTIFKLQEPYINEYQYPLKASISPYLRDVNTCIGMSRKNNINEDYGITRGQSQKNLTNVQIQQYSILREKQKYRLALSKKTVSKSSDLSKNSFIFSSQKQLK